MTLFFSRTTLLRPRSASTHPHVAHAIAPPLAGASHDGYEIHISTACDPIKDALVGWAGASRLHALWPAAAGMAYLVRRLLENTANTSLLAGDFTSRCPRRNC